MRQIVTCACRQRFEFGERRLGQVITCPKCRGKVLLVPDEDNFSIGSDPDMRVFPLTKTESKP